MRLNELLTEKPRPRRMGLVLAAALICAAPLAFAQGMLIKGAAAGPGAEISYSHAVLDKASLTSAFGMRKHPITGEMKLHSGVDLAAEEGTPVYAPTDGVVTVAEKTKGYGNLVQLMAGGETVMRFGQLSAIDVKPGDAVKPGDVIGKVGQSGVATGPHLHFEVLRNGDYFDPMAEEGLKLADYLLIMGSSGVKPPAALAPFVEQAAPEPPKAPVAPEPGAAPVAPEPPSVREPAPLEKTGDLIKESQDAQEACKKLDVWFETPTQTVEWTEREAHAREENGQAGLRFEASWSPEETSYPMPVYPPEAASAGKIGACLVMFDLGTDGKPKNALATCSDPIFAKSAAALPGAAFKPVTGPDGKPVEVKGVTYPLSYCIS